ncbi:hypothetical protein [Brevundimonas sp. Marseille-Q4549]
MQRFRQMKTLQKFGAVHAASHNHFNQDRHLISRDHFKARRSATLAEWKALAARRATSGGGVRSVETSSHWTDSTATVLQTLDLKEFVIKSVTYNR